MSRASIASPPVALQNDDFSSIRISASRVERITTTDTSKTAAA